MTICERFDSERVDCVLLRLSGHSYEQLTDNEYAGVRERLLSNVAAVRSAIFVHESILVDDPQTEPPQHPDDERDPFQIALETGTEVPIHVYFHKPDAETRSQVHSLLESFGLQVLPYRTNAELTVLAAALLAEFENGLLLRVYVPIKRIWANETDRLLIRFRDYLSKVGHNEVTLNQRRTEQGTVYEFFARKNGQRSTSALALSAQFQDFSHLLDLCLSDPSQAEQLLRAKSVDTAEVVAVLTRYTKEAKRLQNDLRQEREQKLLSIRHRLESELVDIVPARLTSDALALLADSAVPRLAGLGTALTGERRPITIVSTDSSSIAVNVDSHVVQTVNSVVAEHISGDVHLTLDDHRLLDLIREHAPHREAELGSAVRELADASAPKHARLLSRLRLKAFLFSVGSRISDVAFGVLQTYLESRLGL